MRAISDVPGTLSASANQLAIDKLNPFWSQVVGAGRANEGLRADWQTHLGLASSAAGFKYVRFHGLYHDDMHVVHEVDGKFVYNFQYIDALFDAILDNGVKPFVELGFCPSLLATKLGTVFWWRGNGSPPKSQGEWAHLVGATVEHWIQRYGAQEVRTWYFECWNEPNLRSFFSGCRSEYFSLYECTVRAIKAVDQLLRVGGPATSNFVPDSRFHGEWEDFAVQKDLKDAENIDALDWKPVWVQEFLQWCHSRSLPVDFVSCHPYPTDWALDASENTSRRVRGIDATPNDLRQLRRLISESPFPSAEIHLTEWNSSPSSRDHGHDEVSAATYIVRTMLASLNLVDTLAYWTFTDVFEEQGAGLTPFHGGFGMINLQSIPKPTFHAFAFLHNLGKEVLNQHDSRGIVTRCNETGLLSAILFHYPSEVKTSPPPAYNDRQAAEDLLKVGTRQTRSLVIDKLHPASLFKLEKLYPGGPGDAVSEWRRLGSPFSLDRSTTKQLLQHASNTEVSYLYADSNGRLEFSEELLPWTVVCISQVKLSGAGENVGAF